MGSTLFSALKQQRWLKAGGSSLAVMMLSAVPAFGLIYTGNWVVQANKQSGGAPKAIIDTSDPAALTVNMGVNSKKNSSSTVVVRRSFRIENRPGPGGKRGEGIALTDQFSSLVRDGLVQIVARIVPPGGDDLIRDNYFRNVGKNSTAMLSRNARFERFLRPGNYTLVIVISYVNRKGFWDNQNSGSPHRFTLSAI